MLPRPQLVSRISPFPSLFESGVSPIPESLLDLQGSRGTIALWFGGGSAVSARSFDPFSNADISYMTMKQANRPFFFATVSKDPYT